MYSKENNMPNRNLHRYHMVLKMFRDHDFVMLGVPVMYRMLYIYVLK